jgi:hypothetical protein
MTIRRAFLLLTIAVVAAAVLSLSGTALAEPPPNNPSVESGDPSCFGNASRLAPGGPGPGDGVSGFTTSATEAGGDIVATAAQEVGSIQHIRSDVCPLSGPFTPEQ